MKRAWVERAKVWVPSGDEPRCAGKDAANVRRYIDDELGIIVWREVGREDGDVAINLGPAGSQHGRLVAHELRIRIISEGTQGRILPPESLISESLGR